MTDEPITSCQIYCATCKSTERGTGEVTAQLVLASAERCQEKGHDVEIQIPAPRGSLADKYELGDGNTTITGRW